MKQLAKSIGDHLVRRRREYLHLCVAVLLTVLILSWLDVAKVVRTLTGVNLSYIVIILFVATADRSLMAYKWKALLDAIGIKLSVWECFRIYMAAGFVGAAMPTSIGSDAIRALRVAANGERIEQVSATIVIERALGAMALIILSTIGLLLVLKDGKEQFQELFYVMVGACALSVVLLVWAIRWGAGREREHVVLKLDGNVIGRIVGNFVSGCVRLSIQGRLLIYVLLLSLCEHGLLTLMNYLGAQAITLDLTPEMFVAIIPITYMIRSIPISIDAIGLQEGAFVVFFGLAGVGVNEAVSLSILMRVLGWLMLIPAGLFFMADAGRTRAVEKVC